MFLLKVIPLFLVFMFVTQAKALHSLNNYGDSSYPGRCVVDIGTTVVLLSLGESVKLENLPCTMIFCIGDGWGMLQTCDYEPPPYDCHYSRYIRWDEEYPVCCKRTIICD